MDAALGLDTSLVTCQYSANIIHLIHPNFTLGSAMITLCKNPAKPALKFLSHVALRTTMHSGATPLLRGFSRKNIFFQKIVLVFKLQKLFLHQNGVEFSKKSKSDLTKLWPLVISLKHAEKMLIQLRSPTEPSWPAVHC